MSRRHKTKRQQAAHAANSRPAGVQIRVAGNESDKRAGSLSGSRQRAGEIAEQADDEQRQVENLPHVGGTVAVVASPPSLDSQRFALSEFRPFPVECLPAAVREFVTGYAGALDCDASHLALPALAVLANAIGNTRVIRLNEFWTEPSILWTAVVGDSGTRKTPPIYAAVKPMWDIQDWQFQTFAERMHVYRLLCATHQRDCQMAIENDRPLPPVPREPIEHRYLVNEVAIESLLTLLHQFPRGLLVCRDELDGWLGAFDAARGGRGVGPAHWLELHGGRQMLIDRRGGTRRTIRVPFASVSLTGTIQPEILAARLTKSHLSNGLFARLLFASPPARPRRWQETDIEPQVTEAYQKIVHALMQLPFSGPRPDVEPAPIPVALTPEARQRFIRFVNEFGRDQDDADPALTASFAKLEGYAARFTLVLHMARWAAGEPVDPDICDLSTLECGIALSHWFANEARRVRALVRETPDEAERRKLIGWLHRRGGQATARDLVRSNGRRYATSEAAAVALDELAEAGLGSWLEGPAIEMGRPLNRVFVLSDKSAETCPTKVEVRPEIRESGAALVAG